MIMSLGFKYLKRWDYCPDPLEAAVWQGASCGWLLLVGCRACSAGTSWAAGTGGLCGGSDAHLSLHRKATVKITKARNLWRMQINMEKKDFFLC